LHRITELSVALLVVVMLVVASSAQMASFKSINSHGVIKYLPWLRVDGIWIVDENGNRIQLRGSGCDYTAYEKYDYLENYFKILSSKRCNVVRLAWSVPNHRYGTTTVYDPVKMDRTLALCEKYGLYAILDCHHYGEFADPNWPPNNGVTWTQDWIDAWVTVATRYKDNPVVAGYEICNEPYGIYFPDVAIPCLNAIRQVDTKHIIFLAEYAKWWYEWAEGAIYPRRFWISSDDTGYGTVVPNDPNIVIHIHHWPGALVRTGYPEQGIPYPDASDYYCEASEPIYFARFLREHLQKPIWMGEFGAYNLTPPNPDLDHVKDIFRLCEEAGIMWTNWMMEMNLPWDYLIPTPYSSSILPADVPKPFNPKPFNMFDYVIGWNKREVGYNRWGSSFYEFKNGDWITLKGPCKVKLVKWNNITDFYKRIVKSQEIITITTPEATITNNWPEFTRIFAYEGS